jgi:EipB-like
VWKIEDFEVMRDVKIVFATGLTCGIFAGPAFAVELASHRALYELSPLRVEQSSKLIPMDGRLAYEITGSACEGYTVSYRIANRFQDPTQGEKLIDTQLNVFEAQDGTQLDIEEHQLAKESDQTGKRVSVKRSKPGEIATGKISTPEEETFSLAPEVLFPSALALKLLGMAEKGLSHDVDLVFDGSDGKNVMKAITFIGKKRLPGTYLLDAANPEMRTLANLSSWPMSTSYYAAEGANTENALYQASFNIYENGVSSELVFDYGTYALKGKITKLELLKQSPCDPAKLKN